MLLFVLNIVEIVAIKQVINIPSKGNCGAWDLGDYNWEISNNKWIKKPQSTMESSLIPVTTTIVDFSEPLEPKARPIKSPLPMFVKNK